MFDFHMHSTVSADGRSTPEEMVAAAKLAGMREICFTDHLECKPAQVETNVFTQEAYERAYGNLKADNITVRFGMEYGMMLNNRERFLEETAKRKYDLIIGSVHTVDNVNVYGPAYWEGKTQEQVYTHYLEVLLENLKVHRDFHVLGHLTHPTKAAGNPGHTPYTLEKYGDMTREVFERLITLGIGIEINTSGVRSSGQPLPPLEFVKQYVELGGEIITIGSDAHGAEQVGGYIMETLRQLKEITPWICTFKEGKPEFHKIESLC